MNQCIECGKVDEIYDAMEEVVEAADVLIDAAAEANNTEEIAARAGDLRISVHAYRTIVKQFDEGGYDAVQ